MSDTEEAGIGHNFAAERLRAIVERHERIEEEVKALRSDQKDIMQEAKSAGYDQKALKAVMKIRKMEPQAREEHEMLVDTYLRALGC